MDLGSRVMSAVRWAASVTLLGQLLTWAMTIVVIRLLTPEDYGLMAVAMLFVGSLTLINELGLGAVLVHRTDLSDDTVRQIFGLMLIANSGFCVLLFLASPWIANFFADGRLTQIIQVLSFQFVIAAFELVPVSRLERDLNFKSKSIAYLCANVGGGIVTLTLALLEFGVWALVWGSMTIALLRTIGVNIVSPYLQFPKFSLADMRQEISFGGLVTLERILWFVYTRADILIVGKILGNQMLGLYSVAMHLSSLVVEKTGGILYEVAFPAFSKIQKEPEKTAAYFLKAVRIMSFLAFPVFFGMSSVANELVAVLLGEKWRSAGALIGILCLVMPLRMLSNLFPPALQGVGRPDISVVNLLLATIVMPIAFVAGTNWGVVGVSIAWLVSFPIVFLSMVYRSGAVLGVSVREVLFAMFPPALLGIVMYSAVRGTKMILKGDTASIIQLAVLVLVGIVTYAALMFTLQRDKCEEVRETAKR